MGKRGPRSKLTEEAIERVRILYGNGVAHRAIADELGISETNIRRIIGIHGIPKRDRKLATLLNPQEEDGLVGFLLTLGPFRGKYRHLRNLMEQFAQESNMKCTFTYSWRDGFVRRHRHRLPPHIVKLLSPKVQREDELDSDLDILDTSIGGESYIKEPSVWKQKPKLSQQQRAIKETTKAFMKAGLTKEEVHLLLMKLKVPGVSDSTSLASANHSDVVAQAINNVFGESSDEPGSSVPIMNDPPSANSIMVVRKKPSNRKAPTKKTPFQLEVLEKAFTKSQTCGDKRAKRLSRILGLSPAQVIYWFHNTARHKRKLTNQASQFVAEMSVDGSLHDMAEGMDVVDDEHVLLGDGDEEAVLEGETAEIGNDLETVHPELVADEPTETATVEA